jgi:phospholipase/carboxylesterase
MLNTVRIPASDPTSRRTLVVLHGLGDSSEGWEWLPGELSLPWMNYVLVNAPDDYFGGYSWYTLQIQDGVAPRIVGDGVARSRRLLHELLEAEIAAGVRPSELSLLGFSQGCLMTLDAGLRFPQPLAGLVGISGWVNEPERLIAEAPPGNRAVPVLVTHGTQDELLPIQWVRPQVQELQRAGFDLVWQEFDKEHTVAGRAEVGFIRRFLESAFTMPPQPARRGAAGTAAA